MSQGQKEKIFFIIYSLNRGGAERVVSVLSNKLVSMEYEVIVLVYRHTEYEYALDSRVKQMEIPDNNENRGNKITRSISRIRKIREILKREKPEYVIPFMSGALREVLLASLGLSCILIGTERSNPAKYPYSLIARKIRDFCLALCDGVYLQNEAQKQYFSKRIKDKAFVLPNPVDEDITAIESRPSQKIKMIITIGRLSVEKNHAMLVSAFAMVHESCPDVQLRIYGDGERKEALQIQIEKMGLCASAFLMGPTDNVPKVLQEADLFVLSSDFEGMPNALMEAMAAGVPCISTDCPVGPSDIIRNGENGLLVPIGNDKALAAAIIRMIRNSDERTKMSATAKNDAIKLYSATVIAEKLLAYCDYVRGE